MPQTGSAADEPLISALFELPSVRLWAVLAHLLAHFSVCQGAPVLQFKQPLNLEVELERSLQLDGFRSWAGSRSGGLENSLLAPHTSVPP